MNFSEKDLLQIAQKGLDTEEVQKQINIFKRGNIKVDISEAATLGSGIVECSKSRGAEFQKTFEQAKGDLEIIKFVPASGAATRMFKSLHNLVSEFNPSEESIETYLSRKNNKDLDKLYSGYKNLPFYEEVLVVTKENHKDFSELNHGEQFLVLIENMLSLKGLGLSDLPKGLVPFHKYPDHIATAFEEHLVEASKYIATNGIVKLHFTVSEGHREKFEAEYERIKDRLQEKSKLEFDITYSHQDPKTDTIAVTEHNDVFRTEDGGLFFRPGGHGALIENLGNIKADLAFITNIDNVSTEENIDEQVFFRSALGGKLLEVQRLCFDYLEILESAAVNNEKISEILSFLKEELFFTTPNNFETLNLNEQARILKVKLNRPLRVCGMVKNEGEPGGGPFLVKDDQNKISLQIIEGAQIDKKNNEQLRILQESTHFNPVDIVCGLRDKNGRSFNLNDFVDERMSFIAEKTKDGKPLKALERPGLWNGAMAKWNTVFVEIPVSTFNPVKTVADLLKDSHQVK